MEASRALVLDSGGRRGTAACLSDGQQRFGLGNKPSSQSQGRADPVHRGLVVLMLSPLPLTHTQADWSTWHSLTHTGPPAETQATASVLQGLSLLRQMESAVLFIIILIMPVW